MTKDAFNVRTVRKYGKGNASHIPLTGIANIGEKFEIEKLSDRIIFTKIKEPDPLERLIEERKKKTIICKDCGQKFKVDLKDAKEFDELKSVVEESIHKDFDLLADCSGCLAIVEKEKNVNETTIDIPINIPQKLEEIDYELFGYNDNDNNETITITKEIEKDKIRDEIQETFYY